MATMLNEDLDMISRMESNLQDYCAKAFTANNVDGMVFGVFSIENLEQQRENDICSTHQVAVGVGYLGSKARPREQGNVDNRTVRREFVDFQFLVLLAVPTDSACDERDNGTKLLTALRLGIMGQLVDNDKVQRTWEFVQETPNVSESTETMLYYSQVWRAALPNKGKNQT